MFYIDERIKKILLFILVPVFIVIILCFAFYNCSNSERVSPKILRMAQDMVFEVVIDKLAEDKTVYDKEFDQNLIPFMDRNDNYYSIGTAFAISKTELITAFHVVDFFSKIYDKYYVRDSKGNVFEMDQITGGSREKDFLIFTVKDKRFKKYFKFKRNYKIGMPVFSIGNAFGEGIIIRSGLLLNTMPEEDSGRWDWLKSSADINPGNSGGPLINSRGKVIALITAGRDNLMRSITAEHILDSDRSLLDYRGRYTYAPYLLNNWLSCFFETQIPLPGTFTGISEAMHEAYRTHYDSSMAALFEEAPKYPIGEDNTLQKNYRSYRNFPEVSYIDSDENKWELSDFNINYYYLDNGERLQHKSSSYINFYRLFKPRTLLIQTANTNPRYIMDTILQAIRINRYYDDLKRYRIKSYGEPDSMGLYKDAVGRTWITAYWIIDYLDEILIMYILPQPNGPTVLTVK